MIIGRLFETLLGAGTVIVTTSNVAPNDLYRDGLNRQLFLPFVRLLEKKFDILSVVGRRDFRLGRVKGHETFIVPLGADADAQLQAIWEQLTETRRGTAASLTVNGRTLDVPQSSRGCARFTFDELCGAPLGPADYLAIAKAYRTVFIEGIPRLGRDQRNETRRMIMMIDTFYDAGTHLVATSEERPRAIYSGAGGDQLDFARTVSRLEEMQSADWWGAEPVPA
jgi:cell division protein ZapE